MNQRHRRDFCLEIGRINCIILVLTELLMEDAGLSSNHEVFTNLRRYTEDYVPHIAFKRKN